MTHLRPKLALTLAVVVAGSIAAPVAAQDETGASIEGPVWELLNIGEAAVEASATMTLDDGTAAIFGGCNSFFGSYTLDGQSLTFDDNFTSTLVECEPEVMAEEEAFIAALGDVSSYEAQDTGILDLLNEPGDVVLGFEETGVATTTDIATIEIEIDKLRASLQHLRGRVHNEDVRPEVRALEAHLNKLTEQHINQRDKQQELRQRIRVLEEQVATLTTVLVDEGVIPMGDTQ